MIVFRRRTLWEKLLRIFPSVRRRQDAALEESIRRLVENPWMPCEIEGQVIRNGFGG